jgi:hypothetical protein
VEDVIIRTLETTPRGATHWSTRGMAKSITAPLGTISRVSRFDRRAYPEATRRPHHHGQLQHAQDGVDPELFAKRPRFHQHFTPTYGSWLSPR